MKIETINERIAKCEEKIAKKQNTIAKKQKAIEKKIAEMKKYGFEYDATTRKLYNELVDMGYSKEDANTIYWLQCDADSYAYDIKRLKKEIPEIEATIEKYKGMRAIEFMKEDIITEMPEIFTTLRDDLTKTWDEFDTNRQITLRAEYKELGYREFVRKYSYSMYDFIWNKTVEQIHKDNEKAARELIIDLNNRVRKITGEITSWKNIECEMGSCGLPVLTGYVEGKMGRAYIETIYAGGYNIQRLHIRVLVHEIH